MGMLRFALLKKHLTSPGDRWGLLRNVGEGRLLPVLLIAALLLCHGVLGFAHQVSCDPCGLVGSAGAHHGSTAGAGGNAGDEHAGGIGDTAYAAVVIAALGATILALLFAYRRRRFGVFVSLPSWRLIPVLSHHPRGPTLPSLQVFRL
jgi:hypothetical protein